MGDDPTGEKMNGCDVCAVKCWTPEGFFGFSKYNWKFLCMPQAPCFSKPTPPLFLGKDEKLPLLLSASMGLQHMLAMCVGIATSGGMLHANEACWTFNYDSDMCASQSFLVSCSWIASGFLTMVQVFRCKIKGTPFYIGTGLVSVMGTSFTFLPLGQQMVSTSIGAAKSAGDPRCVSGATHYSGATVTALIASGIKYVGGGVFCGQNTMSRSATFGGPHICNESGDVFLGFGAAEHWGLALSVIFMGIFIQMLGSPFLKATFLFWSMMFGVIVSSIAYYTAPDGTKKSYWNSAKIDAAPVIAFPWVQYRYPLGFSPEYFLPLLICSYITTAETIGDVIMTAKFSRLYDEEEIVSRQQGGVMADGINSIVACLMGSPPNTTFSQNNGIIALTRCASRSAGFACAFWLLFIGLFGKIGGAMASVPMPIVGGVIVQCFTMVFVAGIQLVAPLLAFRRNQYIVMLSLAFGLGVALEPQVISGAGLASFYGKNLDFNYGLWPGKLVCNVFPTATNVVTPESCSVNGASVKLSSADCALVTGTYTAAITQTVTVTTCTNKNGFCCLQWNEGAKSVRTSLLVILKTPYGIAVIIAALLNFILPSESEDEEGNPAEKSSGAETAAA